MLPSGCSKSYTLTVQKEAALEENECDLQVHIRSKLYREQNENTVACSRANMIAFVRREPSVTGDLRDGANQSDALRSRHCVYVINANAPSQFEVCRFPPKRAYKRLLLLLLAQSASAIRYWSVPTRAASPICCGERPPHCPERRAMLCASVVPEFL